ncbi:reverse transcriptase domain-containing protein [Tanacetum coccineum]|uniref:Reverse transcriptase domain-containing protein n=1 Tax=Tanacetum coccineum TaxID=301880 RepID=A0ABQ5GY75_9ASTR
MSVRLADRSFQYPVGIAENMLVEVGKFTFPADFVILKMEEDSKKQLDLGVGTERMIFNINSAMKHSYSNDDTCFSIDEILEEDFNALLDEGSKILHSIEGTLLEEEIFSEFDKFMGMTVDENYESESIQILDDKKPVVQKQRRINPNVQEVVKKEIVKLLDTDIIYPIADSPWLSPIHCVPKKCDITVVTNENDELVPTRNVTGWRAEAQALPTNDARVVITFLKKLFCHFGMPKALISDRGTHFCNKMMEKTMKRYRVNHRFSTSYHPQTSGQVENTNKALKRILKKIVKDNPAIWSRKLDDALWAFITAYKTPTGTTPYKLIYEKNCHLPFEIEHHAYWALKNCNPNLIAAGEKRMFQLHELDELRHQVYENSRLYKARTKIWHDRKLGMRKEFKHGNKVLLFHSKYIQTTKTQISLARTVRSETPISIGIC